MQRINKSDVKEVTQRILESTYGTCEFIDWDPDNPKKVILRCKNHDITFSTNYDNVRKVYRRCYACPECKKEYLIKRFEGSRETLTCDYCGKTFTRQKSRNDSKSGYNFCCRKCKDSAQRMSSGSRFDGVRPPHYGISNGLYCYRKDAFANYPPKCAVCGWDEDEDVLEVHHIDENRSNNNLDNLIILCPICHRKLTLHKYVLIDRTKIIKKGHGNA